VDALGDWGSAADLSERRAQCSHAIDALRLASVSGIAIDTILDPLWRSLDAHFSPRQLILGPHWLEFLFDSLNAVPTARAIGPANARYARVVLTTLADAAAQTWQAVILADANDEIWPVPSRENPFLPDAKRVVLNEKRSREQPPLVLNTERAAFD